MSYNNNYKEFLTDNGYYRQHLSSLPDSNSYYDEDTTQSFIQKAIILAGLVTTTGGTSLYLYKTGGFRDYMHKFMKDFATQEGTRMFVDSMEAVKKITSRDSTNTFQDVADIVHNRVIQEAVEKGKVERANVTTLNNLDLIDTLTEKYNALSKLQNDYDINSKVYSTLNKQMNLKLSAYNHYDVIKNADYVEAFGMRQATVGDLINANKLNKYALSMVEQNKMNIPDILGKVADEHVFVDDFGEIVDFRPAIKSIKAMGSSAIKDFQIPILGINPMKLFHLDTMLDDARTPVFHVIDEGSIQPIVTRHTGEIRSPLLFANGSVLDVNSGSLLENNMKLKSATHGFQARNLRKLSGIEVMEKHARWDNPVGRAAFNFAKVIDLNMQDEVYRHSFELTSVSTWLPAVSDKLQKRFSPVVNNPVRDLTKAYGNTQYLITRQSKKIGEEGFLKQLAAGRNNLESVTEATTVPYMLMERINASLQSVGLGLDLKHLGSAADVFVNLFGRKILPVVVGIGAIKYVDSLLEKDNGYSPKDAVADTYVTASVNLARAKDKLGVTGFMKKVEDLTPGWDQLEELPLIGRFFSTKDKKETEEYWKHGEDAVRKGRYWTLGNTPYTGTKIEYFEPNWVRRIKSDYKYTDVLYGSKKEYYENWWLPTPTNPLAPVKHFVTDPTHYEDKHYKDRPYPVTGGIAEFREIPLVGGFVDSTLGRLLKPRKKMHLEYWEGDRLKETADIETSLYSNITRPAARPVGPPGKGAIPQGEGDYEPIIYTTSSGQTQIMSKDKSENVYNLNRMLKETSVKSVQTLGSIGFGDVKYGPKKDMTLIPTKPRGIVDVAEDTYYDATEIAGFYGFSFTSLAGDGVTKKPRVQSSADMTSYTRSFWDKNLGGFGGDISEMFRRFVPHKQTAIKKAELNPIRNTMPTWLPGKEYYIDFLHGDPYAKIPHGEYRLPGAGYEAMHNKRDPMKLGIGSSQIGKSPEEMVKHFMNVDDIEISQNANLKTILSNGTKVHEKMEKEWEKMGLAVASEVRVVDEEHGVEGFIDSIIRDRSSRSGYAVVDFKTISNKGYKQLMTKGGKPENVAQINFYMYKTGQDKAYLHYINRDDPNAPTITFEYDYNEDLMKQSFKNLDTARAMVHKGIDEGTIARGDLYSVMDRYRILADVAPYSDNYRYYNQIVSKMELSDGEKEEVAEIREQVSQKKAQLRFYPYKFRTANLKYQHVKVTDILDDGTFLTEEYGNHPIKLAGINFSYNEKTKEGQEAMDYLKSRVRKGVVLKIGYTADPLRKYENDTYNTINAVVLTRGRMLNKDMVNRGLAEEKESDDSPAGIHAKYTEGEITYGKIWETAAHRDTFFHTKMMQVRSPLEMYKRRDLYGKDWQEWTDPYDDFLKPAVENRLSKGFVIATLSGAFLGSLFGSNKYGKILGASIGGFSMATMSFIKESNEAITNKDWIPERRRNERELNEYMDILKFIKNRKLYEEYRDLALKKEGIDPAEIIRENKWKGKNRKKGIKFLTRLKRDIHNNNITFEEAVKMAGYEEGVENMDDLENKISTELENLRNFRETKRISPLAAQAIMYYNESEKTAYGYDPGEPLQNILSALNRKERRYFQPFLDAPEEERNEILRLVPKYMKRALQSAYGMKSDKKPDLEEYFRHHALPDEDWAGWNPEVSLDDVKIKLIKHEGMDMSEFDYWPDDELRAEHLDIPVPKIDYEQSSRTVKRKLYEVLKESGLEDIEVEVNATQYNGINMNVNIENDRRNDIKSYVNNYGIM